VSVENVQRFYEAIACDEGLRLRLTELSRGHRKGEMDEARIAQLIEEEILPIAAQMGCGFSLADLWRHAEEIQQSLPREDLDEDELDAVTGGSNLCVLVSTSSTDQCACSCYFIGAGSFLGAGGNSGSCFGSGKNERSIYACFLAGNLPP
jgi:hypothetical protein